MAPVYKIALIQLQPEPVAPAANFARAAEFIARAAAAGCHLAVLPEYHLTGWAPAHPSFAAACAASEPYLARYQALARQHHISIVPGTICARHHQDDDGGGGGDELRNMAHFVAAGTGAVAASYQKKNLWHPERPHLSSGGRRDPHAAFDTPLLLDEARGRPVRAGLLVCWDLAFPEAFRALIADGAHIIIVPSYWLVTDLDEVGLRLNPDSERDFINAAVVSRAFENTACVVFCNKGGCSQVAMPIQGRLKADRELGPDEEGVSIVEVDMDVLRVAEENYKVREDIRGKGWHYGYELSRDGNSS